MVKYGNLCFRFTGGQHIYKSNSQRNKRVNMVNVGFIFTIKQHKHFSNNTSLAPSNHLMEYMLPVLT